MNKKIEIKLKKKYGEKQCEKRIESLMDRKFNFRDEIMFRIGTYYDYCFVHYGRSGK